MVCLMFDIFKNEAGDWEPSRIIELDGFLIDYMRLGSHLELSFCEPDRTQFAFIVWRIKSAGYNYWTNLSSHRDLAALIPSSSIGCWRINPMLPNGFCLTRYD